MKPFVVYSMDGPGTILSQHSTLADAVRYGNAWQALYPTNMPKPFKIYENRVKSILVYDSKKAYRDAFAEE